VGGPNADHVAIEVCGSEIARISDSGRITGDPEVIPKELPTILLEAAESIQGIAVSASKATVLLLRGQLPHAHRLPGGSPVFPLVVRDLLDMGSVVPHHEQFAVGLRRIRVNPSSLKPILEPANAIDSPSGDQAM
jgi:hypothetical protein